MAHVVNGPTCRCGVKFSASSPCGSLWSGTCRRDGYRLGGVLAATADDHSDVCFSSSAILHAGSIPYPMVVFEGRLPWSLLSQAFDKAANDFTRTSNLVSRVYRSTLRMPLGVMIACRLDSAVAAVFVWVMPLIGSPTPSAVQAVSNRPDGTPRKLLHCRRLTRSQAGFLHPAFRVISLKTHK